MNSNCVHKSGNKIVFENPASGCVSDNIISLYAKKTRLQTDEPCSKYYLKLTTMEKEVISQRRVEMMKEKPHYYIADPEVDREIANIYFSYHILRNLMHLV